MTIHDLVLVYVDRRPSFFARIEEMSPDIKPRWWHVKLLVLSVPLEVVTWILDEAQIHGEEFTMGGTPVRLERVVCPPQAPPLEEDRTATGGTEEGGRVIPFDIRRRSNGKLQVREVQEEDRFCPECRLPPPMGARYCPRCGTAIEEESNGGGFEERIPCADESCIGIIGSNGRCGTCGKRPEEVDDRDRK